MLMDQGLDQLYFTETAKYLFISDNPEGEEMARLEFDWAGLNLNYANGSLYLGAYLGPMEELE